MIVSMHNPQQIFIMNTLRRISCSRTICRIDCSRCKYQRGQYYLNHNGQEFQRNKFFYQHLNFLYSYSIRIYFLISFNFVNVLDHILLPLLHQNRDRIHEIQLGWIIINFLLYNLNQKSNTMSADKLKEIERNLAEQESFVQSIIQQRQKKSRAENNANIDNILSSSIQKAKQKISLLDPKLMPQKNQRSSEIMSTSRQKRQKGGQEGSAIAGAMKKLQERISSLEQENKRLQAQSKEVKKREIVEQQKNENLQRNVQQNKRKIKNLQSSIQKDKKLIRQLQKRNQNLQKQLTNKKTYNSSDDLEKKLSTSEMMYRAQEQQFKNIVSQYQTKQRKLLEVQNKRKEEQIRYSEQLNISNTLCRQMQLKVAGLEQKSKQKDLLIQSLKNQIKSMDAERVMKSSTIVHNSKIDQFQEQQDRQMENRSSKRKMTESIMNKENQLEQLKDKYQQLFIAYKNIDQKNRQQKLELKNYRNKFWQLKEAVKELIQKIHTLPSGINSQLKFLIVKINKIQTFSNDYFAATPTKSVRKTSLLNSTSRSRSNSKKKDIKLDLNRSNNSQKSKKSSHTNRSTESKKSAKSKEKQVIVSQKTIKKSQIAQLQSQIQEIRKRYKQLVLAQNKSNEQVSEDVREELNNLAVLLQERSEQLTKLKRKK